MLAAWLLIGAGIIVPWNLYLWRQDRHLPMQTASVICLKSTPRVSVLVAAWNEASMIVRHIETFKQLRYSERELILCAGGTDSTYEHALQFVDGQVTVLEQHSGQGKQRALRECLKCAKGEIIYLTDADCLFSDDAFERTLMPIINDEEVVVTGGSKPLTEQLSNPFVCFQSAIDYYAHLRSPDPSPGLMGRNCAVEMQALIQVGGFNVNAVSGTDYTLARQLSEHGHTICNARFSLIETAYPDNLLAYFHKRTRWLRNIILISLKTQDYGTLRQGLQSVVVAMTMIALPILGIVLGQIFWAIWLIFLLHGICSRLRYVAVYDISDTVPRLRTTGFAILGIFVDFVVWNAAFVQALIPRLRSVWR